MRRAVHIVHVKTPASFGKLAKGGAVALERLHPDSYPEFMGLVRREAGMRGNKIYEITGRELNRFCGNGKKSYPDDMVVASISLSDVKDRAKLRKLKSTYGMRWFSEIVEANPREK